MSEPASLVKLVIATTNRGKMRELTGLLAGLRLDIVAVSDTVAQVPTIVEDADTFEGNALKKALSIARAAALPTLADDSGLEVEAIGGRPGVRSARFAHEHATDEENNAALLEALAGVADERRGARYRCVLALVDPGAVPGEMPIVVEGTCDGRIARAPRGSGGFGYDPLFLLEGEHRTVAELTDAQKNCVSHRARAAFAMRPHLAALVERRKDGQ
jgi:XTP/dITP diphosphohydrolase